MRWLDTHVKKSGIEELVLFAPARLRVFVDSMSMATHASRVRSQNGDFAALSLPELQRHADILDLVLGDGERGSRRAS